MPRSRSLRSRVTTYRLITSGGPLAGYIRPGYTERPGFTATEVMVGGVAGLLVCGHFTTEEAKWAADLAGLAGLAGLPLGNRAAAAVLLLPVGEAVYAATYGMGHLMLDYETADPCPQAVTCGPSAWPTWAPCRAGSSAARSSWGAPGRP